MPLSSTSRRLQLALLRSPALQPLPLQPSLVVCTCCQQLLYV